MTSNIGSAKLTSGRGKEKEGEAINAVMKEFKSFFAPEFLNRLDEVIIFVIEFIPEQMPPLLLIVSTEHSFEGSYGRNRGYTPQGASRAFRSKEFRA